MLRVALVLDDYNELVYLQTVLRKIGVDVEGLQNVKKYEELSLGFNPQLLIVSAFGKKVHGLEFIKGLHRPRGVPKIILLNTSQNPASKQELEASRVDLTLESPVNPKNLIHALAQLSHLDEQMLLEKFDKLQSSGALNATESIQLVGQDQEISVSGVGAGPQRFSFKDPNSELISVVGGNGSEKDIGPVQGQTFSLKKEKSMSSIEREKKYKDILKTLEPLPDIKSTSYKRDRIFEFNKKIRAAPPVENIKEIESDRKEFVKHLFVKGKEPR